MKLLIRLLFVCVFVFTLVSCSKDDDVSDPVGTVTLNMLNEENGKTELGEWGVYIDKANNFCGSLCVISPLGKKNGLGNISTPVLDGYAPGAAVDPGCAYQIFGANQIYEFPSGKKAVIAGSEYYNVYVVSEIVQESVVVGATVKFAAMMAPDYGLPEYYTEIGSFDKRLNGYEYEYSPVEIELPSADFEYCIPTSYFYDLEHEKQGNKIVLKMTDNKPVDAVYVYVRIEECFTVVYATIE